MLTLHLIVVSNRMFLGKGNKKFYYFIISLYFNLVSSSSRFFVLLNPFISFSTKISKFLRLVGVVRTQSLRTSILVKLYLGIGVLSPGIWGSQAYDWPILDETSCFDWQVVAYWSFGLSRSTTLSGDCS